jgi:outer membrane protein TolC
MSRIIGLILFFSPSALFFAQDTFSLFEAQLYAIENAEKYKREQLEVEIAKKQIVETRAMGLPQINGEVNFQHFLELPVQVFNSSAFDPTAPEDALTELRAGTDYNSSAALRVNQLIFDGSYIVGLQVSRFYKSFVDDNLKKTKQEILMDVTQAYELTLVSRENKLFLDTLVAATKQLLEKQEALFELGMITEEDVDQIRYSLLQAETNLSAANYTYDNAVAMLKLAMAYPQDENINLSDDLETIMRGAISSSLEGDISNNLDLLLLSKRKRLSEYDLQNMKMNNLPSLGAFFNQSYNYFSNDIELLNWDRWFAQSFVGVSLSIPIFSSGERWAKVQKAKIAVKQDEYAIQELERTLKFREIQLKNDFSQALKQIELQRKNVELAQRIYNNSLQKAEIGKENPILVTQKYSQLVGAQTQRVNAMIDMFNARLNLDQLYNNINTENE